MLFASRISILFILIVSVVVAGLLMEVLHVRQDQALAVWIGVLVVLSPITWWIFKRVKRGL